MAQILIHSYFENSAEEFHLYETISASMKLSSSLNQCSVMSAYLMPMKLYETPLRSVLCLTQTKFIFHRNKENASPWNTTF
jgi:hypothetical protein